MPVDTKEDGANDCRPRGTPVRFTARMEEGVPEVEARFPAMEGRPETGVAGVRGLPNMVVFSAVFLANLFKTVLLYITHRHKKQRQQRPKDDVNRNKHKIFITPELMQNQAMNAYYT